MEKDRVFLDDSTALTWEVEPEGYNALYVFDASGSSVYMNKKTVKKCIKEMKKFIAEIEKGS